MTILQSAPKSKKSSPRPFTYSIISMTLEINDTRYACDEIPAGESGTKAFRLGKHSGDHEVYDVIRTHEGIVECSCPDYVARHEGTSSPCKHGRALVVLGLLPAPAPVVVEAPCCDPIEPAPCLGCVEDAARPAPDSLPGLPDSGWDALEPAADDNHVSGAPNEWGPETDAFVWSITDPVGGPTEAKYHEWSTEAAARVFLDPAPTTFTLAELADHQAAFYRGWDNAAGRMFAAAMDEVALKVRLTRAESPAEYRAGFLVLDAELRDQYEQGRAAREPELTSAGRFA